MVIANDSSSCRVVGDCKSDAVQPGGDVAAADDGGDSRKIQTFVAEIAP